jgi:hypothetical protein
VQDNPAKGTRRFFASDQDRRKLLHRAIPKDVAANIEWTDSIDDADVVIDCAPGTACEIYGPEGIVRVASLPNDDAVTERMAEVAVRADAIAELLSIDETGGSLDLRLGATGRAPTDTAPVGTRGIQLTASVANHRIRFYDPLDERSQLNSLQLNVQTDTPCYLTLVSVDSAGTVQQLLPNPLSEQARFVPDGHLQARQTYLVPDSFADDNRAGFHLDYVPPAGTDTVRAFCTVERGLAVALREDIAAIAAGRPGISIGRTLITARGLTGLRPQDASSAGGAWGTATITIDISGR